MLLSVCMVSVLSLSKGPLDLLLTAPEDLEGDDLSSFCDSNVGSPLSTRTVSLESMPSLSESYTTDTYSSGGSPHTPSRRRKAQPTRRSLEPVSSPPGTLEDHPLSSPVIVVVDELDFRVFENEAEIEVQKTSRLPFKPLRIERQDRSGKKVLWRDRGKVQGGERSRRRTQGS